MNRSSSSQRSCRRRVLLRIALLAPFCFGFSASQTSTGAESAMAVRRALDAGTYEEAERRATASKVRIEVDYGAQSLEYARSADLLVEALVKNGKAGTEATLALAEAVVRLKQKSVALDRTDLALSMHNLGTVRVHRGEFLSAVSGHERALALRVDALGTDSQLVADSLDQLALALILLERFSEAGQRLAQSRRIRELQRAESAALARTLTLLALLQRSSGDYAMGVSQIERALEIQRRLAPEHPDVIASLQVQGDLRFLKGDIRGGKDAWSRAVRLAESTLRAEHPVLAELLRRVGLATFAMGNLAEARQLRETALRIGERSLAPCDPAVTALITGVAISRQHDNQFAEARALYRRVQTTIQACAAAKHVTLASDAYATAVYNEAAIARDIGDLAEADRLYRRAVEIWSQSGGRMHPFVAKGLDAVAEVAAARGQFERARRLYERALVIRRLKLGPEHPDVAWTLTSLAQTSADSGRLTLAARFAAQALDIFKRTGPSDEPDHLARLLALSGDIELQRGEPVAARARFKEALAIRELTFGRSHPLAAESRALLASADARLGAYDVALEGALEAERSGREHLQFTVRYLPERQAMFYADKRPRALDLALSIAASKPDIPFAVVFDSVIQSRGVILDELAARAKVGSAPDQQTTSVNAAAIQARQQFANLVVRSLQERVPLSVLDEARQRKEDAERALAEGSAMARAEMGLAQVGFKDVDAALPPQSALLSFVVYEQTQGMARPRPAITSKSIRSYGAFVHRSGGADVRFVRLGTAATIDALINAWRVEASGHSIASGLSPQTVVAAYQTAGVALRRAIWDPLRPHLEGAERTFVVPDGLLNIVNLAALPIRRGHYLVEDSPVIHYLSTERDLIPAPGRTPSRGLLAVGGATFGATTETRPSGTSALRSGCDGFGEASFPDLPGSRREVIEIGKFWPAQGPDVATILSGVAATEAAVKLQLGGRRILHFATHGFFLGGDCSPTAGGSRSVGGLIKNTPGKGSSTTSPTLAENPLLLAGLAFAGANRRRSVRGNGDDGILTAEEIGGLNLQGTEWAVLSACDTGLGEIRVGEGVFGLRRAFQIAGAQTVIMSLWSVEDRSAMVWMRALYEGRLRRGLDTAEAVREASLTVLRDRRARGQSTHPFYWAAFVAAGDWR